MPLPLPETIFDAERMSRSRATMPTALSTAELRELGAEVLARSVFTARGTSMIFVSKVADVVNAVLSGSMSEGEARAVLGQTLDALGYDSEAGGFPDDPVPPALKGTLQDLRSFRRLDLIVRTQVQLMRGAGEQWRGQQADMLSAFPAWELIRVEERMVPRDWQARWKIAGGNLVDGGRMIALKGDPLWGELGSYDNFSDALGVDHPPFAFLSGMGWRMIPAAEVERLGIKGPAGETAEEWLQSGDGVTLTGKLPELPKPRLSLDGVPPELIEKFKKENFATVAPGKTSTVDFSSRLARSLAAADAAYGKEGTP
jgi:hypothetical protein